MSKQVRLILALILFSKSFSVISDQQSTNNTCYVDGLSDRLQCGYVSVLENPDELVKLKVDGHHENIGYEYLKVFFNNNIIVNKYENTHWIDDTGKSIVNVIEILSKNKELLIAVSVYDMNEDLDYADQVSVEIASKEYESFLRNVTN